MSEERMGREIDRQIGAALTAMWTLQQSIVVKKEQSWKKKLLIYWLIHVSTLAYGRGL